MFENKYQLRNGFKTFDSDYNIAFSWNRLSAGDNIKKRDIILKHHEALEHYLTNKYNYSYSKAHSIVERKYNYSQEVEGIG